MDFSAIIDTVMGLVGNFDLDAILVSVQALLADFSVEALIAFLMELLNPIIEVLLGLIGL